VFKFAPIVKATDSIPYDTNVKLEHPFTENFVHGEGGSFFCSFFACFMETFFIIIFILTHSLFLL